MFDSATNCLNRPNRSIEKAPNGRFFFWSKKSDKSKFLTGLVQNVESAYVYSVSVSRHSAGEFAFHYFDAPRLHLLAPVISIREIDSH